MTKYRQVGGRLGAYIRTNNPTTQQIQGVIADLLAGDKLLPTMREVATMPAFAELQRLAGSGGGSVQRDALLQELAARYLPEVVERVSDLLGGMLEIKERENSKRGLQIPPSPRLEPPIAGNNAANIHAPKGQDVHLTQNNNPSGPSREIHSDPIHEKLSNPIKDTQIAAAVISIAIVGIGAAILAGISSTQSTNESTAPITPDKAESGSITQRDEVTQNHSLTSITGELSYPGTGIPQIRICAIEITSSKEICKSMPESPVKYQYKLDVPAGTYNVFYETLDGSLRFWNGACSDTGNLCGDYYVHQIKADPSIPSVTADLGGSAGLQRLDGGNDTNFIF